MPFAVVGAVVISRRSRNAVGWLCCSIGGSAAAVTGVHSYAVLALVVAPQPLPSGVWAAWVGTWLAAVPAALILVYLPLLFPTGRLPSRRWRVVGWLGAILPAVFAISAAVEPGDLVVADDIAVSSNPVGLAGADPVGDAIAVAALVTFIGVVLAAAASLVVRYRRADVVERQQLKWLLLAVMGLLVTVLLLIAARPSEFVFDLVAGLALVGLPIALGIAVLRYGLYEIDRLLSRTVTYGLLTAVLATLYLASVVVLGALLRPITGYSDLAVAGSTLVVAAVFGPLRRRLQAAVDRRFNRARYDAQRTVEAFRSRLRDKLDLDELSADLLATVGGTVQPAHTSVWLRPTPR